MNIAYDGREAEFDESFMKVTVEEWRQIKDKLNLTVRGVLQGMIDIDPDAITAARWLVLRAAGDHGLVLDAKAEFSVMEFAAAWKTAEDAVPEPEPDPTLAGFLPAGMTPPSTGSSTPTSENSPASTPSLSPGTAASVNGKPASSPSPASSAM